MAVLPGVLGCRLLRRTVQVRLGTNPLHAAQAPALRAAARWHVHLHGLATAMHELSGLSGTATSSGKAAKFRVWADRTGHSGLSLSVKLGPCIPSVG
jgi:hypothetical protein